MGDLAGVEVPAKRSAPVLPQRAGSAVGGTVAVAPSVAETTDQLVPPRMATTAALAVPSSKSLMRSSARGAGGQPASDGRMGAETVGRSTAASAGGGCGGGWGAASRDGGGGWGWG